MILQFLFIGGDREEWLQTFQQQYESKIAHHYRTEVIRMKSSGESRSQATAKRQAESALFLNKFKSTDFVVLFDERGENLSSPQFAKKFESWLARGKSRIIFCVGGAFGFDDEIRGRADAVISLSAFVLNHHVAQAVVLEQVYRSISIQKNLPYHNE